MTSVVRFEEWQEPTGITAATTDASGNVTFDNDVTVSGDISSVGDIKIGSNSVTDVPRVLVSDSDGQTLNASVYNTLTFDEEAYDTHGMHSTSTNNSRLIAPAGWGGYYWVYAVGVCTTNGNYASIFRSGGGSPIHYGLGGANSDRFGVYGLVLLNPADYVEVSLYSVSGGNVYGGVSLGGYSPTFGAYWVAPA